MTTKITDEDLYGLTAGERRALRGAANGGWVGSPGRAVCESLTEKTGVRVQSEASRGESRSFYALTAGDERIARELVARLDKLPRRRPTKPALTEKSELHDWYHDGVSSDVDGRLCRTCRFRENALAGRACLGDRTLHDAAFKEGERAGRFSERDRVRRVLGI